MILIKSVFSKDKFDYIYIIRKRVIWIKVFVLNINHIYDRIGVSYIHF